MSGAMAKARKAAAAGIHSLTAVMLVIALHMVVNHMAAKNFAAIISILTLLNVPFIKHTYTHSRYFTSALMCLSEALLVQQVTKILHSPYFSLAKAATASTTATALTPPLLEIPEGFWYCPSCTHKEEARQSLKGSQRSPSTSTAPPPPPSPAPNLLSPAFQHTHSHSNALDTSTGAKTGHASTALVPGDGVRGVDLVPGLTMGSRKPVDVPAGPEVRVHHIEVQRARAIAHRPHAARLSFQRQQRIQQMGGVR
ncbi:MAG: hypothetical protein WDW36_004158 [Sanguina aurantia]